VSNLKTAAMVTLLLAILYGVYTVLHQPEPKPPSDFAEQEKGEMLLNVEMGEDEPVVETSKVRESGTTSRRSSGKTTNRLTARAEARRRSSAGSPVASDRTSSENRTKGDAPPRENASEARQVDARIPDESADEPNATHAFVPPPELRNRKPVSLVPAVDPRSEERDALPTGTPAAEIAATSRPDRKSPEDLSTTLNSRSESAEPDPDMPRIQRNPFVKSNADAEPGKQRTGGITMALDYEQAIRCRRALDEGRKLIGEQRWREALLTLSVAYEIPELSSSDREELLALLDPLAAKVIYSTDHLLESSYSVRRGESLQEIAERFDVSAELLQNINSIANPQYPAPGSTIKVVRGPFRAVVDLSASEVTIYLQRYYAGRFPLSIGHDPEPIDGEFRVLEKQPGQTYYLPQGKSVAADDPGNPYGRCWIDLGKGVIIHGSPLGSDQSHLGCISLSPKDAEDIYAILSVGSKVTVLK